MSFIKKIRIKNFKNLEDVEIDIKPLTFLFGPNGSGKSTFIQALMFLSNNINQCFSDYFGIKTSTNYILNNGINLGSFKDIVRNGNTGKEISFEFNIQGEFEFFKKEILDTPFEESEMETAEYLKNTDFDYRAYNNIFDIYSGQNEGEEEYLCNKDFNFSVNVSFLEGGYGFDLYHFEITDNIYKLHLKKIFENEGGYNSGFLRKREFSFSNNTTVSKFFNRYLGFYFDDQQDLEPFNLKLLPSLDSILENYLNPDKVQLDWENYSREERIDYYYKVLKFCYIAKRIIPQCMNDFLSFKHLPSTRENIKSYYLTNADSSYVDTEYNEMLNSLLESQREVFDVHEKISKDLIDSFRKCMTLNSESRFEKGIYIEYLDNGIRHENVININFKEITPGKHKFKYNTYFYLLTNYYLNKFEFKLICYIDEIQNGKIVLLFSENGMFNASNSSSGFMQVFPIIIYCGNFKNDYFKMVEKNEPNVVKFRFNDRFYIPDNPHTLLIEQPELHLHPRLQSYLAELFSDTTKDSNNNLVIETHSEHLIRKMQVLIANGELDREKVSVLYFDNKKGSTKVEEMKIDEKGLFVKDWPDGFFDDSINLTMELYEALRKNKN